MPPGRNYYSAFPKHCGHCDNLLNKSAFYEHKKHFFNKKLKKWTIEASNSRKRKQFIKIQNDVSARKLHALRKIPRFADLVFVMDDLTEILAHKAILTQYSMFALQFCAAPREVRLVSGLKCTEIRSSMFGEHHNEFTSHHINTMLDFVYGLKVNITQKDFMKHVKLAIALNMPDYLAALLKGLSPFSNLQSTPNPSQTTMISQSNTGSEKIKMYDFYSKSNEPFQKYIGQSQEWSPPNPSNLNSLVTLTPKRPISTVSELLEESHNIQFKRSKISETTCISYKGTRINEQYQNPIQGVEEEVNTDRYEEYFDKKSEYEMDEIVVSAKYSEKEKTTWSSKLKSDQPKDNLTVHSIDMSETEINLIDQDMTSNSNNVSTTSSDDIAGALSTKNETTTANSHFDCSDTIEPAEGIKTPIDPLIKAHSAKVETNDNYTVDIDKMSINQACTDDRSSNLGILENVDILDDKIDNEYAKRDGIADDVDEDVVDCDDIDEDSKSDHNDDSFGMDHIKGNGNNSGNDDEDDDDNGDSDNNVNKDKNEYNDDSLGNSDTVDMDDTDVDDLYNTDDIDHDDSDISCDSSSYSIDILFKRKHNKIKVDDKPSSSAEDPRENDSITEEEHVMQASKMKYLDMVKDKEEKMDKSDEETKQSCPTFHLPDEASEEEKLMYASKMKYLTMAKEKGVLKKWEESATNEDATHKETEKEEELNRAIITQCYEGKAQDSQEGLLDDGKQSKYETVKEKESKRTIITQRYEGNAHDDPEGLLVFNDLPGGKRSMTKGACTHCDETFDNVEDLRKHLETVHNMVSCTICPKRIFAHNQSRVLHELSHKDSYPYIIYKDNWVCRFKCYKCPKEFTVSHKMASHLAIEHKEPPKKYHCPKCDIRFMMIRSFDLHFVKHFEDLQEGQCKICGKVLTGGFQCLKTHMQAVHERRRDHMCSICGHKTNQSGNLHRHMIRSHPNKMKKPLDFKCHICDKRFPLKDFLSRHMNTHGPNSYVCSICGEKLSSSEGFKRHWYTHTDVKRFHCFVCGKGYNDKRDVIRHSKKTHQINVDQDQISMTEAQKNFERELAKRDDPNKKSSKLEPL